MSNKTAVCDVCEAHTIHTMRVVEGKEEWICFECERDEQEQLRQG